MTGPADPPPFRASRHSREVRLADWRDAEELAAWHMRHVLRLDDVAVTAAGHDGGVDAKAANAIAQVKHHGAAVGSPEVQQLRGAAFAHRLALFYSLSGFTPAARAMADEIDVAIFVYDVYGDVRPDNPIAHRLTSARPTPDASWDDVQAEFAKLADLVTRDPNAAALTPRQDELGIVEQLGRRAVESLRSALAEQLFALERYELFSEGPDWYEANGGAYELVFTHVRTHQKATKILNAAKDRGMATRAEAVHQVEVWNRHVQQVLGTWHALRATLPPDKIGRSAKAIDLGDDPAREAESYLIRRGIDWDPYIEEDAELGELW